MEKWKTKNKIENYKKIKNSKTWKCQKNLRIQKNLFEKIENSENEKKIKIRG